MTWTNNGTKKEKDYWKLTINEKLGSGYYQEKYTHEIEYNNGSLGIETEYNDTEEGLTSTYLELTPEQTIELYNKLKASIERE